MANLVDISQEIDPTSLQPISIYTLNFLQASIAQQVTGVVAGLNPDIYNNSPLIALRGCTSTLVSGSTYAFSSGFMYLSEPVFDNGEIFLFSGSTLNISNQPIVTLNIYNDSLADPIQFTDGTIHNVHNNRILTITDGASGSGLFDYSAVTFFNTSWSAPTYSGTYIASGAAPLQWKKEGSRIYIEGVTNNSVPANLSGSSTVFTIPYAPKKNQFYPLADSGTAACPLGVINTSGQFIIRGDLIPFSNTSTYINISFDIF